MEPHGGVRRIFVRHRDQAAGESGGAVLLRSAIPRMMATTAPGPSPEPARSPRSRRAPGPEELLRARAALVSRLGRMGVPPGHVSAGRRGAAGPAAPPALPRILAFRRRIVVRRGRGLAVHIGVPHVERSGGRRGVRHRAADEYRATTHETGRRAAAAAADTPGRDELPLLVGAALRREQRCGRGAVGPSRRGQPAVAVVGDGTCLCSPSAFTSDRTTCPDPTEWSPKAEEVASTREDSQIPPRRLPRRRRPGRGVRGRRCGRPAGGRRVAVKALHRVSDGDRVFLIEG